MSIARHVFCIIHVPLPLCIDLISYSKCHLVSIVIIIIINEFHRDTSLKQYFKQGSADTLLVYNGRHFLGDKNTAVKYKRIFLYAIFVARTTILMAFSRLHVLARGCWKVSRNIFEGCWRGSYTVQILFLMLNQQHQNTESLQFVKNLN